LAGKALELPTIFDCLPAGNRKESEGGEGVNNAMKISMIEALVPAASSTKSN
jgi:hypothetical protein